MPKCNRTRYALRRLADGPRHGIEDYASQPNAGLWCRNKWSSDIGWRNLARHPGFDHTYDHRWGLAGNIVVAWVVTLPVAAIISALDYWLSDLFH
jgi:phosphate/sulfate permease